MTFLKPLTVNITPLPAPVAPVADQSGLVGWDWDSDLDEDLAYVLIDVTPVSVRHSSPSFFKDTCMVASLVPLA